MVLNRKFWLVKAEASPDAAEVFAESLGDTALATSVVNPPRASLARIEWLYDAPPDMAELNGRAAVAALLNGCKPPKLKLEEIPRLDWLKKVAADFPPLPIARWTVHGAQHRKAVPDRRKALQIDATNAFGTGEHPTTRGCLLMLDRILKRRKDLKHMLDVGCGSGILAMAFTKTTHGRAVAVDLDPDSVLIAAGNRDANGLRGRINVGLGKGYTPHRVKKAAPYDLIMSNIFARPLAHMAKDLKRNLRPGGLAILAGLLNSQANLVLAAHRMQGLRLVKRLIIGEWSILVLERPNRA